MSTSVHKVKVEENVEVFYREAGEISKPTILLLHGYPTSSHMFRNLIPLLAPHFHVVAPDLPGFGFTEVPASFNYTFDSLGDVIYSFVKKINLTKFAIYIFDYGSPVGIRLALKDPKMITGIVSQNGNAYIEGIDDKFWGPIKEYWATNNQKDQTFLKALGTFVEDPDNIVSQYNVGVEDISVIDPLSFTLDEALLRRPGQTSIQLQLFFDYRKNIDLYPKFQEYLRSADVPVLLTWGKNDYIFNEAGSIAFKRDVKNLKISNVNSGHFALETHVDFIAEEIISFLLPQLA